MTPIFLRISTIILLSFFAVSCSAQSNKIIQYDYVTLYGTITQETANDVIKSIHKAEKSDKHTPILMFINSNGGNVFAGLRIIDAMNSSHRNIYTIDIGIAASMAAYIHSFGDKRFMLPNAVLMFHHAKFSSDLDIFTMKSRLNMITKISNKLDKNVCSRSNITLIELQHRESDEWWILSDEALNRKLIDDIIQLNHYPVK